jgi:hypothetical protein
MLMEKTIGTPFIVNQMVKIVTILSFWSSGVNLGQDSGVRVLVL